ncbi:murein hydrolase activator EnvC family protein [Planctobacterium marinum]|uniref:murein hydrolase activator EnvC family protein n=1 Tax=Planctobacterium marinum TaxID=1631968 RepID=UPI001E2F68C7|nr:peptidoglycan DD-metalloendopeptidase family protein [Planctobacterium marinum]MCC2607812.1 peptidoglycan DD-metalloendopeptidase family protein [Planctobacterium marinum]
MLKTSPEQSFSDAFPSLLTLLLLLTLSLNAGAQTQDDLKSIQDEIKSRQTNLNAKVRTAESLQQQLKNAELEISQLTKASIISAQELKLVQAEQRQLQNKHDTLTAQKQTQLRLLANQIKSAYLAGDHDYTKLLLNQESAGKFERMLVYYQYLNDARKAQIDSFTQLIAELQKTAAALQEKQTQIEQLQAQQQAQQQALKQQQNSREIALNEIQKTINSDAEQIEQLQINEQQLSNAIAEALAREAARKDIALSGLNSAKGKLIKPVNGKYRRLFGKRRQGQVRWKGVIFEAPQGRPVSAIHQGKVIFADWLKGMGLVTVIDHGAGYMSLYGHTQALLKQVGDVVEGGETIALVGQSGGQQSAGLYFELRHKGAAINPSNWLDL